MTTFPLHRFAEPIGDAWRRPLSVVEILYVGAVLFLFGTAYCQVYCAISMPAMNGGTMPLELSMWRSAIETIPAMAAFEVAKRVLGHVSGPKAFAAVAMALLGAGALSVAFVLLTHVCFYETAMPIRLLIADRLPGLTLTAVAIAWAARRANSPEPGTTTNDEVPVAVIPPASHIEWIRAAGNYVEIRAGGRTVMLRMTMSQAEAAIDPQRFLRIHRSTIVNRDRIAEWDRPHRPQRVRLDDGTLFSVGESYRNTVAH